MKYKLTIIKYEENKNYEAELAKQKKTSRIAVIIQTGIGRTGKENVPAKKQQNVHWKYF